MRRSAWEQMSPNKGCLYFGFLLSFIHAHSAESVCLIIIVAMGRQDMLHSFIPFESQTPDQSLFSLKQDELAWAVLGIHI